MDRVSALRVLASARQDRGLLSVATMQAVGVWSSLGQADERNYNAVGCMGSAASVGVGLAVARPHDEVLVIDGDGSLLMQLGSMVAPASARVANFTHVVLYNGMYETSGGQGLPGGERLDLCGVATATGYASVADFGSRTSLTIESFGQFLDEPGPRFASVEISAPGSSGDLTPVRAPGKADQVARMRAAMVGDLSVESREA